MLSFRQFIKEQTKGGLTMFDIDETLFHTYAKILVIKDGEIVRELDNQEFNHYKLKQGEEYDFGQFRDGEFFRRTSKPNIKILQRIPYILKNIKGRDSKVIFLTARARPDNEKDAKKFEHLMRETFKDHGIFIKNIDIIMTAGSENKKRYIDDYLKQGYQRIRLYDDHDGNLRDFLSLRSKYPNVEFTAFKVKENGSYSKITNIQEKDMSHCDCGAPKGFSCIASCKSQGKIARTGGKYKGEKIKSKKYGGPA